MSRHGFFPSGAWIIFQVSAEVVLVCKNIEAIMNNIKLYYLPKIGWKNLPNIALIVKLLYWPVIFKDNTAQVLLHIWD